MLSRKLERDGESGREEGEREKREGRKLRGREEKRERKKGRGEREGIRGSDVRGR